MYFHRLEDFIRLLEGLESEWIDRRALQNSLAVSKTVAWRILRRCGAVEGPGGALVCRRVDLIAAFTQVRETGEFRKELTRRARVEQYLASAAQLGRAKQRKVVPDSRALELLGSRFSQLPAGVELGAHKLTIEFFGTEDFLEKVGSLVFALQNDYEAISAFIEQAQ
jgi:hypothetical protein